MQSSNLVGPPPPIFQIIHSVLFAEYLETGEYSEATEVHALGCIMCDFLCFSPSGCNMDYAPRVDVLGDIRKERADLINSELVSKEVGKQGPLYTRSLMVLRIALTIISTWNVQCNCK